MSYVRKRLLGLGLLVLLAGSAALAVVLQQRHLSTQEEGKRKEEKLLKLASEAEASSLTLTTPAGRFKLARQGESWRIVEPLEAPADSAIVKGILEHLAGLSRTEKVGGDPSTVLDLKVLELDPPKFTVTVDRTDGQSETLLIGAKSSFDGAIYTKLPAEPQVSLVPGGLEYQLDKDLFALRDKQLATFAQETVTAMHVALADGTYEIARSGDEFQLKSPRQTAADREQVTGILSALANVRATAIVSEQATPEALKQYGLEAPKARVDLDLGNAGRITLRLSEVESGGTTRRFATRDGGPILEIGSDWALKKLLVSPASLADKHVIRFDREAVRAIELKQGDEVVTFEKRHDEEKDWDRWYLTAPQQAKAQDSVVTGLLYKLWSMKAARVVREGAGASDVSFAGLDAGAPQITLFGEGGAELGSLRLGKSENGERSLTHVGSGRIDAVEESVAAELSFSAKDYIESADEE